MAKNTKKTIKLAVISTLVIILLAVPLFSNAQDTNKQEISYSKIIDLTHPLYNEMPYWPGGVPFKKTTLVDYDKGYQLHKFEMGENTGTHVDAPSHFIEGKPTIDQIPLSDLIVSAVVINIQEKVAKNPDYQLSAIDVVAWEDKYGEIPPGSLVMLNTGWGKRFVNPQEYLNLDQNQVMHFPGFGEDSARLLIERDVVGIGIDTLSIDYGASEDLATHKLVLAAEKYQIENLANLNELPSTGIKVIIGVLPIKDGSQAQARILALLPVS